MTSTLQRLESKGFVKVMPYLKDGRGKRVSITGAGKRAREVAALAPQLESLTNAIGVGALEAAMPFLTNVRTYLDEHGE